MNNKQLRELAIIGEWISHGQQWQNNPESKMYRLPRHPEFVYRLTGKWVGWNNFLGVKPGAETYFLNEQQDRLEENAWEMFEAMQIRPETFDQSIIN